MQRVLTLDVGLKNLSYCWMEQEATLRVREWNNLCVLEDGEKCTKMKIHDLTERVLDVLADVFGPDLEVDGVYIENQPMLKNGMMKTIGVVIFTFFHMLRMQYGKIGGVFFLSATNKLKCKRAKELEIKAGSYKDRKESSIALAGLYVDELCPDKKAWFLGQKKKDDLADALLMAVYALGA